MTGQATLAASTKALNQIKGRFALVRCLLNFTRALLVGTVVMSLWATVRPEDQLGQLLLGAITSILTAGFSEILRKRRRIRKEDLALALEMEHGPRANQGLESESPSAPLPPEWAQIVEEERQALTKAEIKRLLALASTLVVPALLMLVAVPKAAPSFKRALHEVTSVALRLNAGASIKVLQGSTSDAAHALLPMNTSHPLTLELLAQNLLEVQVAGAFDDQAPALELRHPEEPTLKDLASGDPPGVGIGTKDRPTASPAASGRVFQSFQLTPLKDASQSGHRFAVAFAVSENVDLYIPALDGKKPFAHLQVRQLPIPKVKLALANDLEDPWPDDQPLNLRIQVKAENPIQTVRLVIKSGQRTSKELVANVVAEDKMELSTEYRLLLETYVESDLAQVEITAEAVDRSLPTPLTGISEPVKLNTASAYGRYRQALNTLKELKSVIDEGISAQKTELPPKAEELAQKAAMQSEKSPFFDGLDRVQIHRFESRVSALGKNGQPESLLELGQTLNDFLFEHEILDDRERDRDFFVAARALSRLVETPVAKRPVSLKTVTQRLQAFLEDRHGRWTKRVERLPKQNRPTAWGEVQKRPFHKAIQQVEKLDDLSSQEAEAKKQQLTALSKSVVEFRGWIEALEASEDKSREEDERKRQEGLASAKDTLRELQRRQGEISSDLDRASERSKSQMEALWPQARMKENTNLRETKQLEGQMRSLSQTASMRIQAAVQAMEATTEAGNSGDFVQAESTSDLAGRLLRQAENAAQESQQKRRTRGRRRQVTGDNYYGQSVVGGDVEIKREYQVDRRYREDILEEVQSTTLDTDDRALLENYLREVIR